MVDRYTTTIHLPGQVRFAWPRIGLDRILGMRRSVCVGCRAGRTQESLRLIRPEKEGATVVRVTSGMAAVRKTIMTTVTAKVTATATATATVMMTVTVTMMGPHYLFSNHFKRFRMLLERLGVMLVHLMHLFDRRVVLLDERPLLPLHTLQPCLRYVLDR